MGGWLFLTSQIAVYYRFLTCLAFTNNCQYIYRHRLRYNIKACPHLATKVAENGDKKYPKLVAENGNKSCPKQQQKSPKTVTKSIRFQQQKLPETATKVARNGNKSRRKR